VNYISYDNNNLYRKEYMRNTVPSIQNKKRIELIDRINYAREMAEHLDSMDSKLKTERRSLNRELNVAKYADKEADRTIHKLETRIENLKNRIKELEEYNDDLQSKNEISREFARQTKKIIKVAFGRIDLSLKSRRPISILEILNFLMSFLKYDKDEKDNVQLMEEIQDEKDLLSRELGSPCERSSDDDDDDDDIHHCPVVGGVYSSSSISGEYDEQQISGQQELSQEGEDEDEYSQRQTDNGEMIYCPQDYNYSQNEQPHSAQHSNTCGCQQMYCGHISAHMPPLTHAEYPVLQTGYFFSGCPVRYSVPVERPQSLPQNTYNNTPQNYVSRERSYDSGTNPHWSAQFGNDHYYRNE